MKAHPGGIYAEQDIDPEPPETFDANAALARVREALDDVDYEPPAVDGVVPEPDWRAIAVTLGNAVRELDEHLTVEPWNRPDDWADPNDGPVCPGHYDLQVDAPVTFCDGTCQTAPQTVSYDPEF